MARPRKISTCVAEGDRLGELKAQRRVIAAAMDAKDTPPANLRNLSQALGDLAKEIDRLESLKANKADSADIVPMDSRIDLKAV